MLFPCYSLVNNILFPSFKNSITFEVTLIVMVLWWNVEGVLGWGNKWGIIYMEKEFLCWQSAFGSRGLNFKPAKQFRVVPSMSIHIHSLACAVSKEYAHMILNTCTYQCILFPTHTHPWVSHIWYSQYTHTKGKFWRGVKPVLLAVLNLQCSCRGCNSLVNFL